MKRKHLESLLNWHNNKNRKPFLLNGTKGVGKTYLIFDFSKLYFSNTIYLNFERDSNLVSLFNNDDYEQILSNIEKHYNRSFQQESTVLILDEIIHCPNILFFINKYISCTTSNDWKLICIKSTIFNDKQEQEILSKSINATLYPFDFEEFLWATGHEWYAEVIREHYQSNKKVPDIVHKELLDLLELYLYVGGMPRAINEYIQLESVINVKEQQNYLLEGIYRDAIHILGESDGLKVKNMIQTMNQQLCKKNKKFQYKIIRKGATQSQYEESLQYLIKNHILLPSNKMNSDSEILYLYDIGVLNAMMPSMDGLDEESRRGLIENYIGNQFIINHNKLCFWESNATARINFIAKDKLSHTYLPIEVSIDNNTRTKSLNIFKQEYPCEYSIKLSTNNFGMRRGVKYVPLYAAFCIS